MPQEKIQPTDHFDPEQWSGVYDADGRDGNTFVFRRGAELVLERCLNISSPGRLWIDVGCGTGDLAAKLCEAGRIVTGLDHDIRMIEYARKRFLNELKTGKLIFMPAGAHDLPFGDETVDGIAAASLMGCLSSPDKFLSEAHRVLRRGGFAVITYTNRVSLLLKINRYIRKMTFKPAGPTGYIFLCRLYNTDGVVKDLQKTGFKAIDIRYYNFFLNCGRRLVPPKSFALYLEGLNRYKIGRRLGRNFIVVAQKM